MTTPTLLALALLALLAGIAVGIRSSKAWLAATVAACALALVAAALVLGSGTEWEWRGTVAVGGDLLHLRLDGLSAFFMALLAAVGGAGAMFATSYWSERLHPRSARAGRLWWSGLVLGMALVLVASNGLHFLIGWEGFTVCAYFLITLDRTKEESRAAGWLYLGVSHASVLALFAFFAVLAAHSGSWDLGPMREHAELAPLFWLALFGFAVKAGAFPVHIWLPSAHANAPSHVSAILSGVSLKLGIYGLMRFSGWLPLPAGAGWTVAVLGVTSAVLGVAFALGQHDLKRLLAYHSVENIGIILIGLGFAMLGAEAGNAEWGMLALAGAMLHVWNHGLFKSLLFLGAGSVLHATGEREMSRLGGLWRAMPWTAVLFGLGAVAIVGLPPLNGFVSELLVYLGLFDAAMSRAPSMWAAIPAAVLLGVTGALALACFVKVCGVVFLGAPRSSAAAFAHESGWTMRSPMLFLAGACVAIGLVPVLFWPAIASGVGAWHPAWAGTASPATLAPVGWANVLLVALAIAGGALLLRRARQAGVRREVTWDCGYATPAPRMQYTAGSFARIITGWFDVVLRVERHDAAPMGPMPQGAFLDEHTPETVLQHLVEPVGATVMRGANAARALQHGGVQSYLLYLFIGIAALAVVVWLGVKP